MDAAEELYKWFKLSDDLSLTALREKISQLSTGDVTQETYKQHPFLHQLCLKKKNVTLKMVKLILDSFPSVASWETDIFHTYHRYGDIKTVSYALHCACFNKHCPDSVIELLLKEYPPAVEHLSKVKGEFLMDLVYVHVSRDCLFITTCHEHLR